MTSWSCTFVAAVVDDDDEATQLASDGVCGFDIVCHIFVFIFRACEGSIEGIQDDGCGAILHDFCDEAMVICDEGQGCWQEPERDVGGLFRQVALSERLHSIGEGSAAFYGAIDDVSLSDLFSAICAPA
jgi:hypothetical protein